LDSRLRGNDDEKIVVASDKFLPCWFLDSRFCGNDGGEGLLFRINPCSFSFLDSRFCGNDGRVVSVVSDKFCSPDKKYGCFGKKCRLKGFQTAFCF
ncbi:hypothetical protein, partial [Neisseria meningitidis]|uniref:hypothetical protein n=1 Tax=Neisseria meningitidis TaxID=487 RepID=UPI001C8F7ADD